MQFTGRVAGWDPPHRFVEETEWKASEGEPPALLATEWLVEARDGRDLRGPDGHQRLRHRRRLGRGDRGLHRGDARRAGRAAGLPHPLSAPARQLDAGLRPGGGVPGGRLVRAHLRPRRRRRRGGRAGHGRGGAIAHRRGGARGQRPAPARPPHPPRGPRPGPGSGRGVRPAAATWPYRPACTATRAPPWPSASSRPGRPGCGSASRHGPDRHPEHHRSTGSSTPREGWFGPAGEEEGVDTSDIEAVLQEQMAEEEASSWGARRSRRCAATGPSRPTTRPASPTT